MQMASKPAFQTKPCFEALRALALKVGFEIFFKIRIEVAGLKNK